MCFYRYTTRNVINYLVTNKRKILKKFFYLTQEVQYSMAAKKKAKKPAKRKAAAKRKPATKRKAAKKRR